MERWNNHLKEAFFALLRAGLWGTVPEQDMFVSFTEKQWREVLFMAQKQAVLGVIYAGISRLSRELMPDRNTLLKLYTLTERIRVTNLQITAVAQEVCAWFEQEGLEPIVMKGMSVGAFYAEPNLRQPGDLDLFFHRNYEQVLPTLEKKGIQVDLHPSHDKFVYKGILIELHAMPFRPLYPIGNLDLTPIWQETKDGYYRVLNVKANSLLLLLHPAKHFMKEGLGLRQVCDWAVFAQHHADKPEFKEALQEMERQGAKKFVNALSGIVYQYLGVNRQNLYIGRKNEKLTEEMLDLILKRGNFGYEGKHYRNPAAWYRYYWDLWLYIWKSYRFWPEFFWKVMPRRVFFRIKKILVGDKFANK